MYADGFFKRYTPIKSAPEEEIEEKSSVSKENLIHEDFVICRDASKQIPLPKYIELTGPFNVGEPRCMKLRSPLVVRLHKFKKDTNPHDYYFSELELYYIFKNLKERQKCVDDVDFCKQVYLAHFDDIQYVRSKTMPYLNQVEDALVIAENLLSQYELFPI